MVAVCFYSLSAKALIEVGDRLPNLSWQTSEGAVLNLDDLKGGVKVLLYNGGFCGPCNSEFSELIPKVGEFDGKGVVFISLSVAGWSQGSKPTTTFLKEWKARHNIPFTVAAAPVKEPYGFFSTPYIPNVVIVRPDGTMAYKAINPGVSAIFREIRRLLK